MELSIDTHEALYRQAWCQYFGPTVCETLCLSCEISLITPFTFECAFIKAIGNGGEMKMDNILPLCLHCYGCLGSNENLDNFMKENCLPGYKWFDKTEDLQNLITTDEKINVSEEQMKEN